MELRRSVGGEAGVARVLANVGLTYHDWGRYEEGATALRESIQIADRIADPSIQGYARLTMGDLYLTLEEILAGPERPSSPVSKPPRSSLRPKPTRSSPPIVAGAGDGRAHRGPRPCHSIGERYGRPADLHHPPRIRRVVPQGSLTVPPSDAASTGYPASARFCSAWTASRPSGS
jgi:hypothetical protein